MKMFETKYVPAAFEEVRQQYLIRMNRAGRDWLSLINRMLWQRPWERSKEEIQY